VGGADPSSARGLASGWGGQRRPEQGIVDLGEEDESAQGRLLQCHIRGSILQRSTSMAKRCKLSDLSHEETSTVVNTF